ncbi:tetratricopeptide repeat protein [Aurantivibrio infirmus]
MRSIQLAVLMAFLSVLIVGCSSIDNQDHASQPNNLEPAQENQEIANTPSIKEKPPAREFPIETFYALLVAEIAGDRARYDIALANYMQEAQRTRDPGVVARATRIARLLNADQVTLPLSLLWIEVEEYNSEALLTASAELTKVGRLPEAFAVSEKLQRMGSTSGFQNIAVQANQITDIQRETLLEKFNQLLLEFPEDLELLVGKAMLLQQQQNYSDALIVTERALLLDEDNIAAAILEARLLYQLDQSEQALDRLLSLLQKSPNNQRLRLQYARLLANIDLPRALEQFQILVDGAPNDPEFLFSLGLVSLELGEFERAKTAFQTLIENGQQLNTAHFYLGQIDERTENFQTALQHYLQVQSGADFFPALSRAIHIMVQLERYDDTHEKMQSLREQLPDEVDRLYLLEAQTFARFDKLDTAISLLNDALKNNPNSTDLLFSRAMINEDRDFLELAEEDLRQVLKYQPNNANALNALGYTLADRTDRFEEAYDLITQALNIEPSNPAILDSMGWVQYRLGNYEEAELRLREALKAFPDDEIAAHLGEVLWVTGETEQAEIIWQQGLEINPDSKIIPNVMQRLKDESP